MAHAFKTPEQARADDVAAALARATTDELLAELERRGCVLCVYGPEDDDAPHGFDWAAVGGFAAWAREHGASVEEQTYSFMVETLCAEADATGVPREEEF